MLIRIAGAMRFPDQPDSSVRMHYLSDFYAKTEFGLKLLPFNNADGNAWLKFYGKNKIRISGITKGYNLQYFALCNIRLYFIVS